MQNKNRNGSRSLKGFLYSIIAATIFLVVVCIFIAFFSYRDIMYEGKVWEIILVLFAYFIIGFFIWSMWSKYFDIKACRCDCGYNFEFPEDVKITITNSCWTHVYRKHGNGHEEFHQDFVFECKCRLCGATKTFSRSFSFDNGHYRFDVPEGAIPKRIYKQIVAMFEQDDEFNFEIKDVQYDDSRKISEDNIEYKSGNIEEKTYDAEPVEFDDSNDYIN